MNKTPELNKAFAKARMQISNPHLDSENPHFGNRFASLKAVIESVVKPLAEHGIAIHQELITTDRGMGCITHLYHESGESRSYGPLEIPFTKNDAQGYASASTYARRYALMSVVGVVGDADDDGNAASEPAFSSKQMKTRVWKALRDAAAEEDGLKCRETWDELNTEQQKEVWRELSSGQRRTIKALLDETKREATA